MVTSSAFYCLGFAPYLFLIVSCFCLDQNGSREAYFDEKYPRNQVVRTSFPDLSGRINPSRMQLGKIWAMAQQIKLTPNHHQGL
jgi:hypothetical protein